jgi:hypothetical protein
MFMVQRVHRDSAGRIVEVEGFARSASGRLESETLVYPVAELVNRMRCGDPVFTCRGAPVTTHRITHDFETIVDTPGTEPGSRLDDLATY